MLTFRSRPPGPWLAVAASGSRGTSRRPALYMGDSTCPAGWSPLAPSERAPSRKLGLIVIPKVSGTTGGPRWQWAVAQHEHRAPSGLWWRCETLGEPVYIHKRFHKDVTRRGRGTYGLAARLERPVRGAGTGGGKPQGTRCPRSIATSSGYDCFCPVRRRGAQVALATTRAGHRQSPAPNVARSPLTHSWLRDYVHLGLGAGGGAGLKCGRAGREP